MPELNSEEEIPQESREYAGVDAEQQIEAEEPFPLKEELQNIVRKYFEDRGFETLEITDAHVKVKSPQGGEMTIPNKIAIENAGGMSY